MLVVGAGAVVVVVVVVVGGAVVVVVVVGATTVVVVVGGGPVPVWAPDGGLTVEIAEDGPTSPDTDESDVAAAVAAAAVDGGAAWDAVEAGAAAATPVAGLGDGGVCAPFPLPLPTCGSEVGGPAVSGNTASASADEIGGVFHDEIGATGRGAAAS